MCRNYRTLLVAVVMFVSTACAQLTQPALPPGTRLLEDLSYVPEGHPRQKLDLYLPPKPETPLPVVVWIHGGGWSSGSKDNPPAVRLTSQGYAVASINYRLTDSATFPAQIHDAKAAIRWLRAHADHYGLDPARIGVWGASAGGQLALLLGVGADVPELEGTLGEHRDQSSRVACVVDYFGTVEFRKPKEFPLNNNRIRYLGGTSEERPELAALATPLSHITPDDAPVLIVHGDADNTVTLSHSLALREGLESVGVEVKLITLPGAGHGGPAFHTPRINAQVDEFLFRHLKAPARP